jgi:hypothetical protein
VTLDDETKLAALTQLLDMTNECDWPLLHGTVRAQVQAGTLAKEVEQSYREMVDRKLAERRPLSVGGR